MKFTTTKISSTSSLILSAILVFETRHDFFASTIVCRRGFLNIPTCEKRVGVQINYTYYICGHLSVVHFMKKIAALVLFVFFYTVTFSQIQLTEGRTPNS